MTVPETINQHLEYRRGDVRIVGTGYKARVVASVHIHGGLNIEDTADSFDISLAQMHAALAYYYDNFEQFNAEDTAPPLVPMIDANEAVKKFKERMKKKE
jgi:uncharacterized protein (DUF433 family)